MSLAEDLVITESVRSKALEFENSIYNLKGRRQYLQITIEKLHRDYGPLCEGASILRIELSDINHQIEEKENMLLNLFSCRKKGN